ncbi:hypothetical protein CVT26_013421 [Gymnopilus dilepis]|uniref:Uncharacterized protein n=1 Tax=Gymnopilus dilepis TaxID=231916 RepID=A0A409VV13_9AGAR|nr:hypothetical protein CVT26_013421 [Gymnopilus dilepis]
MLLGSMFEELLCFLNGTSEGRYRLATTLQGHDAPINCFAFDNSGSLLASGGDDQVVRLWDVDTFRPLQTISDKNGRWGQITVLQFINPAGGPSIVGLEWLCIGTGRGQIIIYRRTRKSPIYHELAAKCAFSSDDSVESISYDPNFCRIAITSHYGKVKVCRLKREGGAIVTLWKNSLSETIPRAIFFIEQGKALLVYAMENGAVHYYDAETSTERSVKYLRTAIGNVDVCGTTGNVIVDNMLDGFDLYSPNRSSPIYTFKVDSVKYFVKGVVFGEGGQIIVSGSDHGRVYVFGTRQKELLQSLKHGNREYIIQCIAAKTTKTQHLIVSGAANGNCSINIWKKVRRSILPIQIFTSRTGPEASCS